MVNIKFNNNINTATLMNCNLNNFEIHCYGRDITSRNCTYHDYYNHFAYEFLSGQFNAFPIHHKFPIIEDVKQQCMENSLKMMVHPIESLDDLFEEDTPTKETVTVGASETEVEAPVLPHEPTSETKQKPISKEEQEEIDLQQELEAKFDELFGPIDDAN